MAIKAQFKTGLNQKEIVLDTKVNEKLVVGQVCQLSSGTLKASAGSAAVAGDYIIAQSDMTMEYGHVPVENVNYKYDPTVAASTTKNKKVAVFRVNDATDVYCTTM
jgi:hypothetical protein